jgi:flagellar protein FliJ
MKRFKFRLQTVLEQRERLERQAIHSYAQAQHAQAQAESTLVDLQALKQDMIDGLMTLRVEGSIDPHEQLLYQDYIRQVKVDIKRQEVTVAELFTLAEQFRQKLVDASQDKRVVDKLREHKLDAHNQEAQRREQNEADEMATIHHHYHKAIERAA